MGAAPHGFSVDRPLVRPAGRRTANLGDPDAGLSRWAEQGRDRRAGRIRSQWWWFQQRPRSTEDAGAARAAAGLNCAEVAQVRQGIRTQKLAFSIVEFSG
jgi:hypothetical protein